MDRFVYSAVFITKDVGDRYINGHVYALTLHEAMETVYDRLCEKIGQNIEFRSMMITKGL